MTLYQIEVRANAEQYDILAQQVAREILKLPGIHLPSLAAISTSPSPLTISTSQLYYLTGQLSPTQIDQLIQQLLIDPVTQEAEQAQKQEIQSTAQYRCRDTRNCGYPGTSSKARNKQYSASRRYLLSPRRNRHIGRKRPHRRINAWDHYIRACRNRSQVYLR